MWIFIIGSKLNIPNKFEMVTNQNRLCAFQEIFRRAKQLPNFVIFTLILFMF